jgi:putative oxidoreductase
MADSRTIVQRIFSFDTAMLVLRLVLGGAFIVHGGGKMFGWFGRGGWDATVQNFTGMGIPAPLAAFTIITEFVGGVCVVLGILTRFWAAGLAIIMINAIALVHFADGWDAQTGEWLGFYKLWTSNEKQLALMAMGLALLLGGPGHWAIADLEGWLLGLRRRAG